MWQALREAAEGDESRPIQTPEVLDRPREDPGCYCRLCGEFITHQQARISVQGAHEHRFSNPAGFVFDIGCFRSAPGCLSVGEPNGFYSWFDGFTWRHALCRSCGTHLGWEFIAASEAPFFALILNRLACSPAAPAPGH